jgi:hypothetical protein
MRNALLFLPLLVACSGDGTTETDPSEGGPDPVCTEPTEVGCVDDLILDLGLHGDKVSEGELTNEPDGDSFITRVDATAGGFGASAENPWIYVRFTEDGAERVDIDDETALESMDWHIAAKRFLLRLNGGSSGPSCVGAAPFLEREYESLTEVPEGTRFVQDDFMSADCTVINDSSGLPNSPQVALSPWWSYPGCVATTGVPFLLQLDDGRVVRFVVESYYATNQDVCNEQGSPGTGSANYTWRWAFVE